MEIVGIAVNIVVIIVVSDINLISITVDGLRCCTVTTMISIVTVMAKMISSAGIIHEVFSTILTLIDNDAVATVIAAIAAVAAIIIIITMDDGMNMVIAVAVVVTMDVTIAVSTIYDRHRTMAQCEYMRIPCKVHKTS